MTCGIFGSILNILGGAAGGPIASLVGAGLSGITSLIKGKQESQNVKDTNQWNYLANQETNATNKEIADANNQLQIDLMKQNQIWQTTENQFAFDRERQAQLEMFDLENKYNSPIEQLKRYQEAGINPAVAFAGSLGSASSTAASGQAPSSLGVSPNMPNLMTPTMQAPHAIPPPSVASGLLGGLDIVSNVLNKVSSSRKNEAERKQILSLLPELVTKAQNDVQLQEFQKQHIQFQNELLQKDVAWYDEQTILKIDETIQRIALMSAQEQTEESQQQLNDSLAELHRLEGKIKNVDLLNWPKYWESQFSMWQSNINKNKAETAEAYSRISLNAEQKEWVKANTKVINETLDDVKAIQHNLARSYELDGKLKQVDYAKACATIEASIQIIKNTAEQGSWQVKEAEQAYELAKKKNTAYYWDMAFTHVEKLVGAVAMGATAGVGVGKFVQGLKPPASIARPETPSFTPTQFY